MQAQIRQRKQNREVQGAAMQAGYTPLQAMILSSRMKQVTPEALKRAVTPANEDLTNAWQLPDIDYAADRIASAVINNEPLLLAHDHDVDGVTSGSILREVLIDYFHHPVDNVHTYISHKQKEGYGISDALVNRIFNEGHNAGLCISADQGSCDEPRVARLAKNGIQTVVTDHHHLPDTGPPASAYATVNPCRDDSVFGDSKIAGCHTALLVMQATRDRLVERGHLPKATSDLSELLDISCVGTVADCVSISESLNNRRIVQYGLHLINTKPRPCFQAIAELKKLTAPWDAQTLGFVLGPMINSSGRLSDALPGVRLLRAKTLEHARKYAQFLDGTNEQRKQVERIMKDEAIEMAQDLVADGASGIVLLLPDGNIGVNGIVASRIVERFGRPTIVFSPKPDHPGMMSGSARTIGDFHVRNAMAAMSEQHPKIFHSWGGHQGAGGNSAEIQCLADIRKSWNEQVIAAGIGLGPVIYTDGNLPGVPSLAMLTEISAIGPYGREFETPVFEGNLSVLDCRNIGAEKTHLKLTLSLNNTAIPAVWFGAKKNEAQPDPVKVGETYRMAFSLDANTFRNNTTLQLHIKGVESQSNK